MEFCNFSPNYLVKHLTKKIFYCFAIFGLLDSSDKMPMYRKNKILKLRKSWLIESQKSLLVLNADVSQPDAYFLLNTWPNTCLWMNFLDTLQEYIFSEFIFVVQSIVNDFLDYFFLKKIFFFFFQVQQDGHKYKTSWCKLKKSRNTLVKQILSLDIFPLKNTKKLLELPFGDLTILIFHRTNFHLFCQNPRNLRKLISVKINALKVYVSKSPTLLRLKVNCKHNQKYL